MTSDDIIAIIDTLCDKLGLVTDSFAELVPALAEMQIRLAYVRIAVCIVILAALAIISLIVFPRTAKSIKAKAICPNEELDDHTLTCFLIVADVIGGIASAAVAICEAMSIISWTVAPEFQAIIYITELLGGE